MRVLIVEDNRTNLMVLRGIIEKLEGCEVTTFLDPVAALASLDATPFDLVLVDYQMPSMDGRTFISEMRGRDRYEHVPIVMVTADDSRQTRIDAITAGATDFLNKPVDPVELKARASNLLVLRSQQLELAGRAAWLASEVAKATSQLVAQEEEVVWRLSRALSFRDDDTGDHTMRVAQVTRLIAEELGFTDDRARTIHLAAPLHDIGKVAIPDAILFKPERLSADEFAVMRTHAAIGESILADASSDLVRMACSIAGAHHERWDGSGYPRGLRGTEIPLEGRIASVADVFDALCSRRPYKPAWALERARREIEANAGTQFDPACVAAFSRRWPEIEELYRNRDAAAPALALTA
jgi:putative two-component system response regulator